MSVSQTLDLGGELVLAVGLECDTTVDDLAASTLGDKGVLALGE